MQTARARIRRLLARRYCTVFSGCGLIILSFAFYAAALQVAAVSQNEEPPPDAIPLENVANTWLKRPELQHSLIGLEVMHIPSGHVLFSHNGRRRFVPASTTKVITTACAMDLFGADYRFKTRLKISGTVSAGRLEGNLYIEPSQDPSLKTAELKDLLGSLNQRGVKIIEGKLDSIAVEGGGDRFLTAWLVEDWGQDWMPPSSDLVLDDNLARRDPARGYPLLPMSVSARDNALVSSLLRSSFGPCWVSFDPSRQVMEFWRPEGPLCGGQLVGNPNQYNMAVAKALLKSSGIRLEGKDGYPGAESSSVIGEHQSKPLSEIVKKCLKESDNLYAQQLLRTIGAQPPVNKQLEKATLEDRGLGRVMQWLGSIGVPSGEVVLFDGCGLSRKNCFTPHALNLVHKHMAGAAIKSAYLDVMPLDGVAGSNTGTFRYKTGAMDSVRCISGVVSTSVGEPLAVTVMINAHTPSIRELRMSIGSLIDHLQTLGSLRFGTDKPAAEVKSTPVAPKKLEPPRSKPGSNKRTGRR